MNFQNFSIAVALLSICSVVFAAFVFINLAEVIGQAEETISQNRTSSETSRPSNITESSDVTISQNKTTAADQTKSGSAPTSKLSPSSANMTGENRTSATKSANQTAGAPDTTAPARQATIAGFGLPEKSIVVSDNNIYVVWWTNKTGNWEVMFMASNDNGQTFGGSMNLSNSPDTNSKDAEIVASDNNVIVSWWERSLINDTGEPVFRVSNNSGLFFGPVLRLSGNQTIGQGQTDPDFLIYQNSSFGIKVKYPADWRLVPGETSSGVDDIVGFYAPFENRLDSYQERVWISNDKLLGQNMTLEGYSNSVISHNTATLRNFTLLDSDTDFGVLADHPAYRLVYTSRTQDSQTIKQMEMGTIVNDQVYYLIYYAEPDKYRGLLPVVQDMINSFEIDQWTD